MAAVIASFRGSIKRRYGNQMIVHVEGCDSREKAQALVGKEVTWTSPGNTKIKGKVASAHGNGGAVRVVFEKGMPGQSLGTEVAVQ